MPNSKGSTSSDKELSEDVLSVQQFIHDLNETIAIDKVMEMYAEDAVRIGPFAGILHGYAAIVNDLKPRYEMLSKRTLVDMDLNVVTNSNFAVAHSQQKISTTAKDGGDVKETTLRSHDVLKKSEKGWQIVLQHTSYIANFKTMKPYEGSFIKPGLLHWNELPFPEAPIPIDQAEKQLSTWQVDDVHAQTADQAMHYYGPGDYATVYDSRIPHGRMVGMWNIYQCWLPQMQLKHVDDDLPEFRIWTDGQFAAVYTLQQVVADKLDGTHFEAQIRQTDCLHRVDGQWYSYVESVSFPVDENTGNIIINLAAKKPALTC